MFFLLLLLGFIATAIGVFVAGFGVPIRETSFGAALLVAGSVAITGGFVLVGLAAAVRELQRVVQGLKARASGGPRPVRPMERRSGERREGERIEGAVDKRHEPRLPMPGALGADVANVIPAKFEGPAAEEQWRRPEPEWLQQAMAEIGSAVQSDRAASASDDHRTGEVRAPSTSRSRAATALSPDQAGREVHPTSAASQKMFDTVWPSEDHNSEEEPEQRTDAWSETAKRSAEPELPVPAPARPAPLPAPTIRPPRSEPRPAPILKSGVIDEMAYTLFADGSIEAQMPEGTMRFASIEELRRHLETHEG